jgi:hypothetical protein
MKYEYKCIYKKIKMYTHIHNLTNINKIKIRIRNYTLTDKLYFYYNCTLRFGLLFCHYFIRYVSAHYFVRYVSAHYFVRYVSAHYFVANCTLRFGPLFCR